MNKKKPVELQSGYKYFCDIKSVQFKNQEWRPVAVEGVAAILAGNGLKSWVTFHGSDYSSDMSVYL